MTETTAEQRAELARLAEAATPGPWCVWDGPSYVGGGKDLCIGAGKQWLANMDHRSRLHWKDIEEHIDHPEGVPCDICSIGEAVTAEQETTARYIVAACNSVPALLRDLAAAEAEVERLRGIIRRTRTALAAGPMATEEGTNPSAWAIDRLERINEARSILAEAERKNQWPPS